jgi:hypothetical protein
VRDPHQHSTRRLGLLLHQITPRLRITRNTGIGEAHGSLAALDALEGDRETARRRMEIALRLDGDSFAAALAGVLLASAAGDSGKAQEIFGLAASRPLTHDGRTLLQALAAISR